MSNQKPKITLSSVAGKYAGPAETIIEYSLPGTYSGGLISFSVADDGRLVVNLYRHDDEPVGADLPVEIQVNGTVVPGGDFVRSARLDAMDDEEETTVHGAPIGTSDDTLPVGTRVELWGIGRTGTVRTPHPRGQADGSTVPGVNGAGYVTVQWDGNPPNHTARMPVVKLIVLAYPVGTSDE
jgi:hypothetical protein